MVNAGIRLDNGDQLYFFSNYANIQTNESFNFRLPVSVPRLPADGAGTWGHHAAFSNIYLDPCTSQPTYTGCPAGGWIQDNNVFNFAGLPGGVQNPAFPNAPFYPAGFTPRFYGTTQEFFGTVGYKGTTGGGLHYDVSGSSAQNSLAEALRSTVNPSLGPLSPGNFYIGKFVQRESNLNVDLSYPLQVTGFASPLSVAAGFEYRDETYQQLLGEPASYAAGIYGAQPLYNCAGTSCSPALDATGHQIVAQVPTESNGYGGIGAGTDASQISYGGYIDLEADVTRWLTLGLAGRYEDYSSFGSTTLGKVQARAKATDWLAIRATASTGFPCPDPGAVERRDGQHHLPPGLGEQRADHYASGHERRRPTLRVHDARPEESTNLAAGLVFTLPDKTLLTVDGYDIVVRHRISLSQQVQRNGGRYRPSPRSGQCRRRRPGAVFRQWLRHQDHGHRPGGLARVLPQRLWPAEHAIRLHYNTTNVPTYNPGFIDKARIVNIKHYAPNSRGPT